MCTPPSRIRQFELEKENSSLAFDGAMNDITSFFPLKEFRPFQEETINEIDKAFETNRFVVVEAPTGSGKSMLAATFANQYRDQNKWVHILTVQKALQDQYADDFPNYGFQKGKGAYTCLEDGESCADGICNRMPLDKRSGLMLSCPYRQALAANKRNPVVVHNFDSFYYQKCLSHQFIDRDLLIIDEVHSIENKFADFYSFSLVSNGLFREKGEKFPVFVKVKQYIQIIREERDRLAKIWYDMTRDDSTDTLDSKTYKQVQQVERLVGKLDGFLRESAENEYVFDIIDRVDANTITFRPVFAGPFIYESLFASSKKVLMMSATILDKDMFCMSVGLNSDEVEYIDVPSTFPSRNRPIISKYAGSMSFREIQETLPKMIKVVEEIVNLYPDYRGIIHTGSERVANYIRDHIDWRVGRRFTYRRDFYTVNEMLAAHEAKQNSFIVASGLKEGIDLKNKLSRVQIIVKTPYLDLSDKRTKRRLTIDDRWYGWQTAMLFVQSIGRSVRSPTDKAITYLVDSSFSFFYHRNKRYIPAYIRDALYL